MRQYNFKHLYKIYKFIKIYRENNNQTSPSFLDVIEQGLASSNSMVGFYFDRMEELRMIKRQAEIARSITLLPLSRAHPEIKKLAQRDSYA